MQLNDTLIKILVSCGLPALSGVINLHRINTKNCGDKYSAPHWYFEKLSKFPVYDISDIINGSLVSALRWGIYGLTDRIVIGGGGLLEREYFMKSMEVMRYLAMKGKKVVLWGVGHNNPSGYISGLLYRQVEAYKVVGLRDYGIKGVDWVPCSSCMHDLFDKDYDRMHDFGIVEHESIPIPGKLHCFGFIKIKNTSKIEEMIKFIGSLDCLITNSYHAMYWGMLLGRKVVVFPNSSKMYSFKYMPSICLDMNAYKEAVKSTFVYNGLLEECREANLRFAEKVYDYIGL